MDTTEKTKKWFFFLSMVVFSGYLAYVVFPIYWSLNTSFMPEKDVFHFPPYYWPVNFTFENYKAIWSEMNMKPFFLNSLFVAFSTLAMVMILSTFAGYSISRFRRRGRPIMIVFLATQMFPAVLLIVPLFLMLKMLHLIDTYWSLILVYITFSLPFCTLLMRGFFSEIPPDIEDAAMIDGCGKIRTIVKVLVPIILPGLVATGCFAFIIAWNELLFGVMFINSLERMTLPVGLNLIVGQYRIRWTALSAGGILALIPPLVFFAYIQRYLIRGLASGAIKG